MPDVAGTAAHRGRVPAAGHARTAVVHLVWAPAGLAPFDAFLASYTRHAAGRDHDLVLLYNGFDGNGELTPYRDRVADLAPREIVLAERCLDLKAYMVAATRLEHERICFVNSYSEIASDGWLELLDAALSDATAGAAGATGSWASHLSYSLYQLGLPGAYARAFPSRTAARTVMHDLSGTPVPGAARNWLYTLASLTWTAPGSGRFPLPHLRTNGFLIDRRLFSEVCRGRTASKWATYRLESGRMSITARLTRRGRPPVVVDRHGVARHVADWHVADVFFQGDQRDLLITDNQTRLYSSASRTERQVLSASAWGRWARPA